MEGWKVLLWIPLDFESVQYTAFDQSGVEIVGKWGIREGWGSRHDFLVHARGDSTDRGRLQKRLIGLRPDRREHRTALRP